MINQKTYERTFYLIGSLGCHQRRDRSFHIRSHQLPICARCTGVLIGQTLTVIILAFGIRLPLAVAIPISVLCMLVTFIDWFIQFKWHIESNNVRRLVTGVLGGIGLTGVYFMVGSYLYSLIF